MTSQQLEHAIGLALVGAGLIVASFLTIAVAAYALTHAPYNDPTDEDPL